MFDVTRTLGLPHSVYLIAVVGQKNPPLVHPALGEADLQADGSLLWLCSGGVHRARVAFPPIPKHGPR